MYKKCNYIYIKYVYLTSIELQYQHCMTWCLWTKSHFLCGHWTASNKGKPGDVWLKIGQPKSLCLTHFKICEINSHHQVSNHQIPFITQIQTYTLYTINKYVFYHLFCNPLVFFMVILFVSSAQQARADPSTSPRRIMILRWTELPNPSVSGSIR